MLVVSVMTGLCTAGAAFCLRVFLALCKECRLVHTDKRRFMQPVDTIEKAPDVESLEEYAGRAA